MYIKKLISKYKKDFYKSIKKYIQTNRRHFTKEGILMANSQAVITKHKTKISMQYYYTPPEEQNYKKTDNTRYRLGSGISGRLTYC